MGCGRIVVGQKLAGSCMVMPVNRETGMQTACIPVWMPIVFFAPLYYINRCILYKVEIAGCCCDSFQHPFSMLAKLNSWYIISQLFTMQKRTGISVVTV
uniref:hypothetical protein n=1 Tax=Prevotella fusca TaxID=589436 RepID=UPI003F9EF62B